MNETTIVIGNGFDMDLGWKTSYKNFYEAKKKHFLEFNRFEGVQLIEKENWYNFEEIFRNFIIKWNGSGRKLDELREINYFWRFCRDRLYEYFLETSSEFSSTIDTNSCAYALLNRTNHKHRLLSFNYTNPFKYTSIENHANICNIHGRFCEGDEIEYNTLPPHVRILLGVDTALNSIVDRVDPLMCIVKRNNNNDVINYFNECLYGSKRVVFFGHSLGITDSDYFKPFFESIISKEIILNSLIIITLNQQSENEIKSNIVSWGVDLEIINQYVPIEYIHTEKGAQNDDFQTFLNTL